MKESEYLKSLTKGERRFLSKHSCGLCDHPLDKLGCSAIYERCTEEERITRRKECLKNYNKRTGGK